MPEKNPNKVQSTRKGDRITARYLNSMASAINRNTAAISGPRNVTRASAQTGGGAAFSDYTFNEVSRAESTVTVTDSNGDTHSVNQIDQIELSNSAGEVLTLVFDNPE